MHRDWFIKVISYSNMLQEAIDADFIESQQNMQEQLLEIRQRNEDLEREVMAMQDRSVHSGRLADDDDNSFLGAGKGRAGFHADIEQVHQEKHQI